MCSLLFSVGIIVYSSLLIIKDKNAQQVYVHIWQDAKQQVIPEADTVKLEELSETDENPVLLEINDEKLNTAERNLIGLLRFGNKDEVAIVEGVEDKDLIGAAGHLPESAYPGDVGVSQIYGHRDTVFQILKQLKIDDCITMETRSNQTTFRVIELAVKKPNELLEYYKKWESDKKILALVTCYPFEFFGNAPSRYVAILEISK